AARFQAHLEKALDKKLDWFFEAWLQPTGLPTLLLEKAAVRKNGTGPFAGKYLVEGEIARKGLCGLFTEVTVETDRGEVTKAVHLDGPRTAFTVETADPPRRVVVDKYCSTPRANGGFHTVLSFQAEQEQTLIVYGTGPEEPVQREAAELLQ